ncbi:MAG: pyridoxal-phosphate dependent enzyme [Caldilineaceae bacterium]
MTSPGNHAQGVALACCWASRPPSSCRTTPAIKRAATAGYGATIVSYDPVTEVRGDRPRAGRRTRLHAHPALRPSPRHRRAGDGGLRAAQRDRRAGRAAGLLRGGGLLSGCAIATKGMAPDCRVIGIEPEVADDATRSFRTGTLQTVHNPPTIADGVRTPYLGRYTFPLVLHYVDDMQTVSEEATKEAVRFFFYRMKLVVEPSGALGLAALLSGAVPVQGQRVGVVISGGNIDGEMMAEILRSRIED